MPFEALTAEEIESGQPTRKEIFQKSKDNFDDLESRLSAAEVGVTTRPPIDFGVVGLLTDVAVVDGLLHYRTPIDIGLLGVRALVIKAGSSGDLSVDVEYKRGVADWTSILNAPITVSHSDGDLALESGVLAVTELQSGDILRLKVNSVQVGMEDFYVYVENEVI